MALLDIRDAAYSAALVNNTDQPLATLTAQAAGTVVSGPFYNPKKAIRININITAITGSVVVTVLGYDATSGATWTALASASLNSTGLTRLVIGPNIAASANLIAQDYAPTWIQLSTVVTTGPLTATIGLQGMGS